MRVYDDQGNMADGELGEFSRLQGNEVIKFFERLFDEGMTILEARSLIGYLINNLDMCATLAIANHQMKTKSEEQNDSSRSDHGVATARSK